MSNLPSIYPSLTLFSDLKWPEVLAEYEAGDPQLSFPEYLQEKSLDGDCPEYLFEIAFYEQALFEAKNSERPFPHRPGIYMNPTALFLNLDFDVATMIAEAQKGSAVVIEKEHMLAVYRDEKDEVHTLPLTVSEMKLLEDLEDGPRFDRNFIGSNAVIYQDLVRKKLIIDTLG